MKKFVFTLALFVFMLLLTACGASETTETASEQTTLQTDAAEAAKEVSDTSAETEAESATISGLGIDQGNYTDEEAGVKINIQSTVWGDVDEDVINFTASKTYDTEFGAKILYPDKIYEIHFGDGLWYQYDPENTEIIDPWFDVDSQIKDLTGKDTVTFSDAFVSFIDCYCVDEFGYGPEELIMMEYE